MGRGSERQQYPGQFPGPMAIDAWGCEGGLEASMKTFYNSIGFWVVGGGEVVNGAHDGGEGGPEVGGEYGPPV